MCVPENKTILIVTRLEMHAVIKSIPGAFGQNIRAIVKIFLFLVWLLQIWLIFQTEHLKVWCKFWSISLLYTFIWSHMQNWMLHKPCFSYNAIKSQYKLTVLYSSWKPFSAWFASPTEYAALHCSCSLLLYSFSSVACKMNSVMQIVIVCEQLHFHKILHIL